MRRSVRSGPGVRRRSWVSRKARRPLSAFLGVFALFMLVMQAGPIAARASAAVGDPTVTFRTGGDRVQTAGNVPSGVNGVTFNATRPGATTSCGPTAGATPGVQAGGTFACALANNASYSASPTGTAPAGWSFNPQLGVGVAGGTINLVNYPPFTFNTTTAPISVPVACTPNPPSNGCGNVAGSPPLVTNTNARTGYYALSRDNPPVTPLCNGNIALVFDLSSSITPELLTLYQQAATGFVSDLEGTDAHIATFTFGTNAPAANNPNLPLTPVTANGVATINDRINSYTIGNAQFTNWDGALWSVRQAQANPGASHFNNVIVLTDGDPTIEGRPNGTTYSGTAQTRLRYIESAIFSANAVKAQGSTITAIGINASTTGEPSAGSIANLDAIASPSQVFVTNFADLQAQLQSLASKGCGGSVTVVKNIVPHGQTTTANATPQGGWAFSCSSTSAASPPVTPTVCDPANTAATATGSGITSEGTGAITFTPLITSVPNQPENVTITETDTAHPDFTALPSLISCTNVTDPSTTPQITASSQTTNQFTVTSIPGDAIVCNVYNALPPSVLDVQVAYADSYGGRGVLPSPWIDETSGAPPPNTQFVGCSPLTPSSPNGACPRQSTSLVPGGFPIDAGAIRIGNASPSLPETVTGVSIEMDNVPLPGGGTETCTFTEPSGLFPLTIPVNSGATGGAEHFLILTQTGGPPAGPCVAPMGYNMDTSEAADPSVTCLNNGVVPLIHITTQPAAGPAVTTTYQDDNQVLNTGGIDIGAPECGLQSEDSTFNPNSIAGEPGWLPVDATSG